MISEYDSLLRESITTSSPLCFSIILMMFSRMMHSLSFTLSSILCPCQLMNSNPPLDLLKSLLTVSMDFDGDFDSKCALFTN